jgi:FK506-binding protein 2
MAFNFHHYIAVSLFWWVLKCHGFQAASRLTRSANLESNSVRLQANSNDGSKDNNSNNSNNSSNSSRRDFLASSALLLNVFNNPDKANGVVTDETSTFANTGFDSAWSPKNLGTMEMEGAAASSSTSSVLTSPSPTKVETKQATDERIFNIPLSKMMSSPLGLELADVEFRTNRRVYVKSVMPSSLAAQLGIEKTWVLVSVNGQSTERTDARGVKQIISQIIKSNTSDNLRLIFRDNSFQDQLQALSSDKDVITQVAPAGDTTQRNQDGSVRVGSVTSQQDQQMIVSQLLPPKMCRRGATTDDLLEISYIGRILETGDVFDGSAVMINGKGIPGRGNDVSTFFVLGKQPFGQFPPGWDVGLEGICVGERRRVIIPPVLAYGSVGVPRRGIPPDATLQYDITLVSMNGLATPQ